MASTKCLNGDSDPCFSQPHCRNEVDRLRRFLHFGFHLRPNFKSRRITLRASPKGTPALRAICSNIEAATLINQKWSNFLCWRTMLHHIYMISMNIWCEALSSRWPGGARLPKCPFVTFPFFMQDFSMFSGIIISSHGFSHQSLTLGN